MPHAVFIISKEGSQRKAGKRRATKTTIIDPKGRPTTLQDAGKRIKEDDTLHDTKTTIERAPATFVPTCVD